MRSSLFLFFKEVTIFHHILLEPTFPLLCPPLLMCAGQAWNVQSRDAVLDRPLTSTAEFVMHNSGLNTA